jgi:hypothetical protein
MTTVKVAIIQALLIYGLAFVISAIVAVLIKCLFHVVRRLSGEPRP